MRVTVGTIVGLIATGKTVEGVLGEYPYLEHEDVMEALSYAAWRAEEKELSNFSLIWTVIAYFFSPPSYGICKEDILPHDPALLFTSQSIEGFSGHPVAGIFSSSLLEVAGEALERMKPEGGETCVRVVWNSRLNPLDVQTARAAKWGMHREWCASLPAEIGTPMKARLQRLYDFLQSGHLKVKVLPDEAFGLVHGTAGVITRTDGVRF